MEVYAQVNKQKRRIAEHKQQEKGKNLKQCVTSKQKNSKNKNCVHCSIYNY